MAKASFSRTNDRYRKLEALRGTFSHWKTRRWCRIAWNSVRSQRSAAIAAKNLIRQLDHRDKERNCRFSSFLLCRAFSPDFRYRGVASALQFPGKRRFSFRFPGEPIMSARIAVRSGATIGNWAQRGETVGERVYARLLCVWYARENSNKRAHAGESENSTIRLVERRIYSWLVNNNWQPPLLYVQFYSSC